MSACPHCGRNSISLLRKWVSGSASPARCNLCSGLSYVDTRVESEISFKTGLWSIGGLLLAGISAGFTSSLWPAAMAIAAVSLGVVYYVVRWQRVPLLKVTAEQAAINNRWGWVFFAVVVVLGVLASLTSGRP
jgi:hypothetical protein